MCVGVVSTHAPPLLCSRVLLQGPAGCVCSWRAQPIMLGIHRSDYMMHDVGLPTESILQVEFNTISASFGCLSARVAELHRCVLEWVGRRGRDWEGGTGREGVR